VYPIGDRLELRIRNDRDCVLAVRQGDRTGLLGSQRDNAVPVDVSQPHYYQLIKTAMQALGLNKK
jgi:single-stranded-DNA-specific exonuclease